MQDRPFNNRDMEDVKHNVKDVESVGNPGRWKLVCKASSKSQGWMKSTKSFEIANKGCIVQTETQQRNTDGTNAVSQALVFIPNMTNDEIGVFVRVS